MEESDLNKLISKMTIEEKVQLLTGKTFWTTFSNDRLNIPSIFLADGPHGIRKVVGRDSLAMKGIKAICFPTAPALASSWNIDLAKRLGEALGEECISLDVQILLGPGVNQKRSPLCGRNFEYFSEDPILTGQIGTAFVLGVQSMGVGSSIKHYALNNQEYERFSSNSIVDERTMREIYLLAFEMIIKNAKPMTIMCSYNKINGIYASEHNYLIRDILKNEWGYEGFVLSDWMASNDKVESIKNGLDLEMPTKNQFRDDEVISAINKGDLDEKVVNEAVRRVLSVIFKTYKIPNNNISFDIEQHHQLAREIAIESMVLLKNENDILPLDLNEIKKIAILGDFAKNPRYQGAGSSNITSTQLDIPYDCLKNEIGHRIEIKYSQGYNSDTIDDKLIIEAVDIAKHSDVAIIFAGLPPSYESEGIDREHINLPPSHNHLIEEICKVQKKTVVILLNGSCVAMPWIDLPSAIIEAWLLGQACGSAIVDILLGKINPSGKLSETFPIVLEENPSFLNFGERDVIYGERIFIGYRYYEKKKIKPLFPFGFGLSYTTFEYKDITVDKEKITNKSDLNIVITIKNTGNRKGKEIIQVYVRDIESDLIRPIKELKAFKKIELDIGEEKKVKFTLKERDFAYWHPKYKTWIVESGDFEILVGSSSADIRLKKKIKMNSNFMFQIPLFRDSLLKDFFNHSKGRELLNNLFQEALDPDDNENFLEKITKMNMNLINDLPLNKIIDYLFLGKISYAKVDSLLLKLNSDLK
ncbi:MAG: glycoside hydrolase family 3 C-terminal domain-containing protein [Candidatus Lokiarchaeota archaeon]|nr:glycoside hydrolase family 3 C-terminal domain-containing protein [Candidatus Lokiarchaeota archaeon]